MGEAAIRQLDAVIVGAGFAGLYMIHRLRALGLTLRAFEAGSGVGGTWYWNRYPGARCDTDSVEYSYQFSDALQQEWTWSERFATQPEILRYLEHVADRFDLRRDIVFETRVTAVRFDDAAGRWLIETDRGERIAATYCVMATGCVSAVNEPPFEGLERFAGEWYQTSRWPKEGVDFTGRRVGVIGTGSSAIQAIPLIAEQAAELTVFQRQANYTVPARNAPLDAEDYAAIKADYAGHRRRAKAWPTGCWWPVNEAAASDLSAEEQRRELEARWAIGGLRFYGAFSDLLVNRRANEIAAEFVRNKIRAVVKDPAVAELLCPRSVVGCKRICLDTGYYATYNRPNVTLVDISEAPIAEITREGVRAGDRVYALDALVFAIGFDAMTGALTRIEIRGRSGRSLAEKWADGPESYLGLAIAGFPNLFTITGPGSPSVLTNMVPSIEQHVEWIADCIAAARSRGTPRIEATAEAEAAWVAHNAEVAGGTLFPHCNSWYIGANIPGKPRVFMPYIGGFPAYVQKCDAVAANGYEGFTLSAA
jgi:cyclohexanone monooxygenase